MSTVVKKKDTKTTPVPVRFGKEDRRLLKILEARANAERRSLSGQVKHYARLGLIASDNPDLPLGMIQGILEAREELKQGLGQPYQWGVLGSEEWPSASRRRNVAPSGMCCRLRDLDG